MKNLYIIRGVSGSGKSTFGDTLVNSLNAIHREADMYHYTKDGIYDWKPENVVASHKWCQDEVEYWMEFEEHPDIVISNTSTTEKELKPYLELAEKYGYNVTSLIVENRHGNTNIHQVPEEILIKQEQRLRGSIKLR